MYSRFERLYDGSNNELGFRLHHVQAGQEYMEVLYADIPGNSWNQQRLDRFAEIANDRLKIRTPLTDLPADDPDRLADPGLPGLYWDSGDLVAVSIQVSDPQWVERNGSDRLEFTAHSLEGG